MTLSGWRRLAAIVLLLCGYLGCAPSSSPMPALTPSAAQSTLDNWNPSFCKVAEFYGFYKSPKNPVSQVAYVLMANPSDKAQKPLIFEAHFQLLILPQGQERWFLTSLVTHSSGLSRRQGWDNLMILVKEAAAVPVK
jgi:hypothetical protein